MVSNIPQQTKFSANIVSKLVATPRIFFFAWETTKGRILTVDNSMKRGFIVNRCFLCENNNETCNHLLLRCSVSHNLWSTILGLMGPSWVKHKSILDELLAWEGLSYHRKTFRLVPLTIFRIIWKEKNNRASKEKKSTSESSLTIGSIILGPLF